MKNSLTIIFYTVIVSLLSSCAVPRGNSNESHFELCEGFDFTKSFPGRDGRPLSVTYNRDRKMLFNKDGCEYDIFLAKNVGVQVVYPEDLKQSRREMNYNQCFQVMERSFDERYAGEIKKKLLNVSEKYSGPQGVPSVWYPVYLEGDKLPKGLQTPSSLFSSTFILFQVEAAEQTDSLRNYIFSLKWIKNGGVYDYAGFAESTISGQFISAYKAVFGEYVMTYYHLKKYGSPEERRQTFEDLATYYANIAYRSAGEGMLQHQHVFNAYQRQKTAKYFAQRVFDYIYSMHDESYVRSVKKTYEKRIKEHCSYYLLMGRYQKQVRDKRQKKISSEEYRSFAEKIDKAILSGEERCVND